ncbi:putative nucleoside-diphosphate sugar epimerase [Desulfitobacterium dichloroeliminans LMG P-21439]|uniref:Putative nucleoside-diphosphate sugar epimerase n=1 Tax=Desulfitobacterium dichloroeliminans (strain LMG P-21439 / DCA1) TaxID=871963 RepID=L0F7Q2_DESDL|nr:oxidoreductase [Desulfitobacterium dichloroeliminans]AGA68681.1 putative nucleoside-diphosphate sugar epimerase [Desulfitobacterium dichloroeliminans LMG P-21439]
MARKSALLIGASGLVGAKLLGLLLNDSEYEKVIIFVRKSLELKHPKVEEVVLEFDELAQYKVYFKVNDVFCCLGTTIKKAGTQEAFKKVDVEYPLEIAGIAKEMGAEKFLVISSMGANARSKVFYSRMKGILEQELEKIGMGSLHIFRPSLLLGDRKEFRVGESVSSLISKGLPFLFAGSLRKYKPIGAETVAKGMVLAAQSEAEGVFIHESYEIEKMN